MNSTQDFIIYKERACCFTGHRDIAICDIESVASSVYAKVIRMIEMGCIHFICGGALGFDTIAAVTVINLKKLYPNIKLILAIPHPEQSERWTYSNRILYNDILKNSDAHFVLSDKYTSNCMQLRNRFMVDNSSYCISYVTKASGGAYNTVIYAKSCGLQIYNLAK